MQERMASNITESFIEHNHTSPADRFIINMHSFHNVHLVRAAIPRSLSKVLPLYEDRLRKHAEWAETLREQQTVKRAVQKEKRAAARAKGKEKSKPSQGSNKNPETSVGAPVEPEPDALQGSRKRRRTELDSDEVDTGQDVPGQSDFAMDIQVM